MRLRSWIPVVTTALAISLPGTAFAESAVVSPFVGKSGVDSLQVLNITSLVASEVDFSMSFDKVSQLEAMPAGMNIGCLSSSSCLSGVAKSSGANTVIAGSVAKVDDQFEIFMVNYSSARGIVRKKSWRISSDPTTMADKMSSLVNEILTGKSHEQEAKEDDISGLTDLGSDDLFNEEEEFSFDDDPVNARIQTPEISDYDLDDFEMLDAEDERREAELAARRRAEEEAARRKEEDARRRAEEEAARRRAEEEAARRRAEEERRRAEEEAARRRAEEERRRAAEEARRREEEESARRLAEQRRREEEERARASADEPEDEFELTFAPVSAEDMGLDFAPAGDLITVEEEDGGRYVVDSYDDFDEFDEFDDTPVRRVSDSSASFDEFDELDNLDDDGFDSARVREQERARKEREREEREREERAAEEARRKAEERVRREQDRRSGYDDLDGARSSRSSGGRSDNTIESRYTERQRVAMTARVGTSGYQTLQFITYGGELAFGITDTARIHTGLEAFSVRREFDADQCEVEGVTEGTVVGCKRWNTILPFHVGARYQRSDNVVRPYFGGDLTLTPYTEDFQIAFGFRGRAGVDFIPSDVFGVNLNAGVGLLHGSEMDSVQRDMVNTGLLWQLSAGTVFML
jgi:hypothetical protein